jgi:hypothetical protein
MTMLDADLIGIDSDRPGKMRFRTRPGVERRFSFDPELQVLVAENLELANRRVQRAGIRDREATLIQQHDALIFPVEHSLVCRG